MHLLTYSLHIFGVKILSRVVKRWIWIDKRGKPHNCIELEDGSRYVIEKQGAKNVIRSLEEQKGS